MRSHPTHLLSPRVTPTPAAPLSSPNGTAARPAACGPTTFAPAALASWALPARATRVRARRRGWGMGGGRLACLLARTGVSLLPTCPCCQPDCIPYTPPAHPPPIPGAPILATNDTVVGLASGPGCEASASSGPFLRLADKAVLEQLTVWLQNGGGKGLDDAVQVSERQEAEAAAAASGCGRQWRLESRCQQREVPSLDHAPTCCPPGFPPHGRPGSARSTRISTRRLQAATPPASRLRPQTRSASPMRDGLDGVARPAIAAQLATPTTTPASPVFRLIPSIAPDLSMRSCTRDCSCSFLLPPARLPAQSVSPIPRLPSSS